MSTSSAYAINGIKFRKNFSETSTPSYYDSEVTTNHAIYGSTDLPFLDIKTDAQASFRNASGTTSTLKASEAYGNLNSLNANTHYVSSNYAAAEGYISSEYMTVDAAAARIVTKAFENSVSTNITLIASSEEGSTITGKITAPKVVTSELVVNNIDVKTGFVKKTGGNFVYDSSTSPVTDDRIHDHQTIFVTHSNDNYTETYDFNDKLTITDSDNSSSGKSLIECYRACPSDGENYVIVGANSSTASSDSNAYFGSHLNATVANSYAFIATGSAIGTPSQYFKVFNSGAVYATGYLNNSDIRLKENVHYISIADSERIINNLKVYSFNFINDERKRLNYGLIAQEVQEIAPELVSNDSEYLSVNYIGLIPHLVNIVQQQQKQITELSNKLAKVCEILKID